MTGKRPPSPITRQAAQQVRTAGSLQPGRTPIVGIGASAGGLDALTRLVSVLPADGGMAYVLVQHLEPSHKSLLAELLGQHTSMPVLQATEGLTIEPDHIYVIPAGEYLSVRAGTLRLSNPSAPHGARMPIDFLFKSMAADGGGRATAIVLSGTATDGTVGAKALHDAGGYVIAQDPVESEYDGMPQSVIASGIVDAVLTLAKMPAALSARVNRLPATKSTKSVADPSTAVAQIIALLRTNTPHDFTLYKMGTLQRRIERRMALASIPATDMQGYATALKTDPAELKLLATDLLINVTGFFRDSNVFDLLSEQTVPDIVRSHKGDGPLRVWIAGCSTGEEAYSLAMVFAESIAAAGRKFELCVFASDVDPDAIAMAREGVYPDTIAKDVSAERLARFFVKHEHGFKVVQDLRTTIVFNVQDLLADPPFSKLDFLSCRNLLIYLGPKAQAKAIALFHFALRPSGVLLLGTSETIGHAEALFATVAKSERVYRRIGKYKPGAFMLTSSAGEALPVPPRPEQGSPIASEPALAELCRRLVLENYAPAVVIVNRRHECVYSMGPTDHYLRVAPGYATHDLLAMAAPGLRARLRAAIGKVSRTAPHLTTTGGRVKREGHSVPFDIDVRLIEHAGQELLMIGFVDGHGMTQHANARPTTENGSQIAELERELDTARTDLSAAIHDLESAREEHRAVDEEALSVSEEYQATNEELLTSKEELQSLIEELTTLNGQLQETLERQRTTSNDLKNVLFSTDVATLFLDTELKIRFFTPASKVLFNLIPGDVGRPLTDLRALFVDPTLADDARAVLHDGAAHDAEVEVPGGTWFMRHILPYRAEGDGIEGVVITFTNITEKKNSRGALEVAKREAERANLAKSRFLAAASHDLRQPLQSLALLTGLLAKAAESERAQSLIGRLDQTLVTMSGMLNTMLDINQIEAGTVHAAPVDFVIGDLVERVRGEFIVQAQGQKLELRAVRCGRVIRTDPSMVEQMLRNLVSNALKYTKRGKILLGCRQRGDVLRIEVWDTGVGIAPEELDAIFDEYHQVDNPARERSLGLGLGLSIVQRLGDLLGHRVGVRSLPSRGSVFSIDVALAKAEQKRSRVPAVKTQPPSTPTSAASTGTILVVDDDPDVRDLLEQLLETEGHKTAIAFDGKAAMALIDGKSLRPDLLLADYNLPGGMNGVDLARRAREVIGSDLPVIILTGDISTTTLRDVAALGCVQLNKPVKLDALTAAIRQLLSPQPAKQPLREHGRSTIYIVDDDSTIRDALRELLEADGRSVEDFADCEAFLAAYQPGGEACLLIDAYLPGINGIELLRQLKTGGHHLPAIMITGNSAVPMAVEAMKVGAIDFLEKPVDRVALFASIDRALDLARDATKLLDWQAEAATHIDGLTKRQHEVMDMVLAGHPSKNIAADLHISQRTVENHRASIMRKTGAKSLPALARLAFAAAGPFAPA